MAMNIFKKNDIVFYSNDSGTVVVLLVLSDMIYNDTNLHAVVLAQENYGSKEGEEYDGFNSLVFELVEGISEFYHDYDNVITQLNKMEILYERII